MNWKKFMNEGDYQDFLLRALTAVKKGFDAFRKYQLDRLDALKRSLVYEYVTGKREVCL